MLVFSAVFISGFSEPKAAVKDAAPGADSVAGQSSLHEIAEYRDEWFDNKRDRVVPVKIYYPADIREKCPVIIFSHGLGGSRDGYVYLGEYWARHGYVSVHLQHRGSDREIWEDKDNPRRELAKAANFENSVARARDVSFAIDYINFIADYQVSSPVHDIVDPEHLGVAGHSFGAQTTLLISGVPLGRFGRKNLDYHDDRVSAAVALSPAPPRQRKYINEFYEQVRIPVMHMTGTEDVSPLDKSVGPEDRRIPFDHINKSDQYLLVLNGGDHMVFSGRGNHNDRPGDAAMQQIVAEVSTAFWDACLRDDPQAKYHLQHEVSKETAGAASFEMKTAK